MEPCLDKIHSLKNSSVLTVLPWMYESQAKGGVCRARLMETQLSGGLQILLIIFLEQVLLSCLQTMCSLNLPVKGYLIFSLQFYTETCKLCCIPLIQIFSEEFPVWQTLQVTLPIVILPFCLICFILLPAMSFRGGKLIMVLFSAGMQLVQGGVCEATLASGTPGEACRGDTQEETVLLFAGCRYVCVG